MSIMVRVSNQGVRNESGKPLYYTTDLVNFYRLVDSFNPKTIMATIITDENKIPMLMVQYHESEQQILLCWNTAEGGYRLLYRTYSDLYVVSQPLFPEPTCTKTTAHLTPQFVT